MLIAIAFLRNSDVFIFLLVLKNFNSVQVISILPQSDDELLKNSKYITDRTFWKIVFEKWDSFPLTHVPMSGRVYAGFNIVSRQYKDGI